MPTRDSICYITPHGIAYVTCAAARRPGDLLGNRLRPTLTRDRALVGPAGAWPHHALPRPTLTRDRALVGQGKARFHHALPRPTLTRDRALVRQGKARCRHVRPCPTLTRGFGERGGASMNDATKTVRKLYDTTHICIYTPQHLFTGPGPGPGASANSFPGGLRRRRPAKACKGAATPCHAPLCPTMPCRAPPRHAMPTTMPRKGARQGSARATPCPTMPRRARRGSAWLGWAWQDSAGLSRAGLGLGAAAKGLA